MIYLLTAGAFVASILSGILGMAGGALLLAIMLLAGLPPGVAVPLHAVVQLASNGTRTIAFWKHIRWKPFFVMAFVATPLPVAGLWLLTVLSEQEIKYAMAAVILYATWAPKWGVRRMNENASMAIAGVLGGALGVVVGAVGPLIAPFYLREGSTKEQVVGTKAACQAYLHVIKLAAFGLSGFAFLNHVWTFAPMATATIFGTLIGKWLLGKMSEKTFLWLYRVVLTLLAVELILPA